MLAFRLKVVDSIAQLLKVPRLTRGRIIFAFAVALITDGLQAVLGPAGWLFFDELLDVIAMVLTSAALGFHPLLLPTFIIELIPVADWLPTWTGCTAAVVLLRRRTKPSGPPPIPGQVMGPELLPPCSAAPQSEPKRAPEEQSAT